MNLRKAIRNAVSPELIKPKYRTAHPVAGACYIASEVAYHLLGGKESGYKPMVGRVGQMTHWWLEKDGQRFDPTKSQFMKYRVLKKFYDAGKGCGFLTKEPSKNAKVLLERVYGIVGNNGSDDG
jgi:hypothetical protein